MMKSAAYAFDRHAADYDAQFTHTVVGRIQRRQVWSSIDRLKLPTNPRVLELNCGTGEDANEWTQRGASVLATDISEEMVKRAASKFSNLAFEQLDIREAHTKMQDVQLIFSNFGGFNCLAPNEIRHFFREASRKLPAGGSIVLVIMGKKCWWDRFYMIAKGKWTERNRRNTDQPLSVSVEGALVQTWYYSPKELKKMAGKDLHLNSVMPVGTFIPPSYMNPFFTKHTRILALFAFIDSRMRWPILGNYSDHFLIHFTINPHS